MNKTTNRNMSSNPHQPLEWKAQSKNCKRLAKLVVKIKRVGQSDLSQEDLQVHVKRFGKVQQIKKKVKKLTGIPIIDQTLIFSGRQLDNTERIVSLLSSSSSATNNSSLPEIELTLFLLVNKKAKAVNESSNHAGNDIPSTVEGQLEAADGSSIQQQQQQQELDSSASSSPVPSKEESVEEKKAEEESADSSTTNASVFQEDLTFTAPHLSVVKLSYEGQHRRVPFEGASFSRLTSLCTSFFGVKNVNRMVIRYRDEDGDLVQLSSDAELAYALATHSITTTTTSSSSTGSEARVLKLVFSVKPVQPKAAAVLPVFVNQPNDETASAPSEMRRLRDGDLIQLSNAGFNLVLSPSSSSSSSSSSEDGVMKKNNFVIEGKKDDQSEASQWIVKKVVVIAKGNDKKKGCRRDNNNNNNGNEEEKEEVIFLKNKTLSGSNKQLRVVATGEVQHSGGVGKWARFFVHYLPNGEGIQLRSVGRSLLRDRDSSSSSFLGLQIDNKNNQKQQQQPQGTEATRRIASGTFKKSDEPSKFALRFVQ